MRNWARHLSNSLKCSLSGLAICFRDEVAFRQECLIAIPHFVAIALLPISLGLKLYLTALWFVLVAIELLNTAIEAVVNLASPDWHLLAKKAKDCASAAVFAVLMLGVTSWTLVACSLFS